MHSIIRQSLYYARNKPWCLHREAQVCDILYREVTNSLFILEVDVPMETEMEPETQQLLQSHPLLEKVANALEEVGRELNVSKQLHLPCNSEVTLQAIDDPRILNSGTRPKCWNFNYPALAFKLNGGYHSEYNSIFGTSACNAPHKMGRD